ncbi:30S ribosomal protein S3 [Candidatus Woesearchaeota archaeon]|nr:30S ribosomal protein S3 [Candidatus Woesearchaeota archaeon]
MIERKFVSENMKEFRIKEFVASHLNRVGLSEVKLQRTPLGEKIVVSASRPGLVVGRAGSNIQKLTKDLKEHFDLENPQIEIEEIQEVFLDPSIVAESIASSMERFGTKQFKGAGYKALRGVMQAGALGVEIIISGKVPSQRAKNWRFYEGYLKKCGDIALTGVNVAYTTAFLKTGAVGIKVSIMPGDTKLPDSVELLNQPQTMVEETEEQATPAGEATEEETPAKDEKPGGSSGKAEKEQETGDRQ